MKRILHLSKYYHPYKGGVEDVCYNVVSILKNNTNYEQEIVCFNDNDESIVEYVEGIKVTRVGIKCVIASQPITSKFGKYLRKIIGDFKPDVIHFHAPNPLVTCYINKYIKSNIKLIVHWHSDIVAQKVIYNFIKPIENKLLKRADIIIATSPNYRDSSKPLASYLDKCVVVQNIIEPEKFVLSEVHQKQIQALQSKYQNRSIVLFVGRHVPYKGLRFLVETAHKVTTDVMFVIGGKGPLTDELKESSKNLDNVDFVGRIADEELVAYYYAADIFAFPSIAKNEAFGVVLAEAMYCYTPAVTFTIEGSGVNWVSINQETGVEVENSNSSAFAKAIDNLVSNKELRLSMSLKARERVEECFVAEKIVKNLILLYK